MKRVDYWRRLYLNRVRTKKDRRKFKRKRKARRLRVERSAPNVIVAPALFELENDRARSELLYFLARLRNHFVNHSGGSIKIDFTDTQKMVATGTLMFKAEISRLQRITNDRVKLLCIPPRNHKVAQVLKQTDIFRLLHHRSDVRPISPDVVTWSHAQGNQVEGHKYDDVLGKYDGVIPDTVASGLYVGLTEAMSNCHQHAYIAPRQDGLNQINEPPDWWMFSQERDGRLSVVFCDLGVGIPETLPIRQPGLWQRLKSAFGAPTDAAAIDEAIKLSRSRTEKHYRGKGLKQLVDVIETTPDATLTLYSNRGCYRYNGGNSTTRNYDDSIMGTLITWGVPATDSRLSHA